MFLLNPDSLVQHFVTTATYSPFVLSGNVNHSCEMLC